MVLSQNNFRNYLTSISFKSKRPADFGRLIIYKPDDFDSCDNSRHFKHIWFDHHHQITPSPVISTPRSITDFSFELCTLLFEVHQTFPRRFLEFFLKVYLILKLRSWHFPTNRLGSAACSSWRSGLIDMKCASNSWYHGGQLRGS